MRKSRACDECMEPLFKLQKILPIEYLMDFFALQFMQPMKTAHGYIVLLPNNQLCTRQPLIYSQSHCTVPLFGIKIYVLCLMYECIIACLKRKINKKSGIVPPDLYLSDQHSNILLHEDPGAFSHITKFSHIKGIYQWEKTGVESNIIR